MIFSVPGVPREMKYLMTNEVIPALQRRYQLGVIRARILRTAGIGESTLDEMLGADLLEASNPTVGPGSTSRHNRHTYYSQAG